MTGALVFFLFFRFLLRGKQTHLTFFWRSGGQAAENRWRRRTVEATKRLHRFYIMCTAAAAENRFAGRPRSATGGAEKSGRAAARRSLLRLLLLTKRAPAGDVLDARDQLFVVNARARSSTAGHVKSARDSCERHRGYCCCYRVDGNSDGGSDYCGCGATHHTAGKNDDFTRQIIRPAVRYIPP